VCRLEYKKRKGFLIGMYFLFFITILSILIILGDAVYNTSLTFMGISFDEMIMTIIGLTIFIGISLVMISQYHFGCIEKTDVSLIITKGSKGKKYIIPHHSIIAISHKSIKVRHMADENQIIIYLKNGKYITTDLLFMKDCDVESVVKFFDYDMVTGLSELHGRYEMNRNLSFKDIGMNCNRVLWTLVFRYLYIIFIIVLIVTGLLI